MSAGLVAIVAAYFFFVLYFILKYWRSSCKITHSKSIQASMEDRPSSSIAVNRWDSLAERNNSGNDNVPPNSRSYCQRSKNCDSSKPWPTKVVDDYRNPASQRNPSTFLNVNNVQTIESRATSSSNIFWSQSKNDFEEDDDTSVCNLRTTIPLRLDCKPPCRWQELTDTPSFEVAPENCIPRQETPPPIPPRENRRSFTFWEPLPTSSSQLQVTHGTNTNSSQQNGTYVNIPEQSAFVLIDDIIYEISNL